ncbi:MAG TPA: FliH/SctL family protein [Candidatus Cybelea sp.]|nr:FliH/SctL family protein [Candidatus Cybelea sp.]
MPTETFVPEELETTLRAARRFRAALGDAVDAALPALLRAIAEGVLARELRLEPAAIARVVAAAVDRAGQEHVVAIRVHPSERGAVATLGLAAVADTTLGPGDCRLQLRSGTIDASLRVRLETALAAQAP